jgi:hypothetical protein
MEDEETIHKPINYEVRSSSEISKMRKYIIEFIFQIGERLKQRSLTLQVAVVYIGKLTLFTL